MRFVGMLSGVIPLALATTLVTSTASADVGKTSASGKGKGIVGGALLGGELVCGVEAVAGVESPWAYLGGAVGGAAAGGVGGYFLEQNASARTSLLVMAGGMTLLIPTIVGVLSATAYRPPADYLTDQPPADEPIANPPQPDTPAAAPAAPPPAAAPAAAPAAPPATTPPASTAPGTAPPAEAPPAAPAPTSSVPAKHRVAIRRALAERRLPLPPALFAVRSGALALSVPAIEIQNTYTRAELAMYGVTQATEVHIPVVDVVF